MIKTNNRYVDDFMNSPFHAIFIVHRRVMTSLYKKYNLSGYEIELMLVIGMLCDYSIDNEIVGSEIRKRCSRRFACVLPGMLYKLINRGFINDRRKDNGNIQAWHYISLTSLGLEFNDVWKKELDSLISYERDCIMLRIGKTTVSEGVRLNIEGKRKKN